MRYTEVLYVFSSDRCSNGKASVVSVRPEKQTTEKPEKVGEESYILSIIKDPIIHPTKVFFWLL